MLSPSEESMFRSIEKRAKDPPHHVYRYHPVDLVILVAFVVALFMVLVAFYYFGIKFPLGGYFFLPAETPEAANITEETTANATSATVEANATTVSSGKPVSARVMLQEMLPWRRRVSRVKASARKVICDDRSCRALARYITESLKRTKSPCDNFYEYVCSTWSLADRRNVDEAVLSESQLRRREMEAAVLRKLNDLKSPPDESLSWTYKAYHECKAGRRTSMKSFRNFMELQGLDGFPFSREPPRPASIAAKVARFSGSWPLFTVDFDQDRRTKRNVIRLGPPTDVLFRDFITVASSHERWFTSTVARVAGGVPLPAVFKVEKRVTHLANRKEVSGGPLLVKLSELSSSHKWSWKEYLRTLFSGIANVSRATYVRVESQEFARGLTSLLRSFRAQDLANFIGFHAYLKYGLVLDRQKALAVMESVLHPGWNESITRDQSCLRFITDIEPFLVTYLHWSTVKNTLEPSLVLSIVQNAKNIILNFIEGLKSLPSAFKNAYEDHLRNITYRYLVPKWIADHRMRTFYSEMITRHVHFSGINTYTPVIAEVQKNKLRAFNGSGFNVAWSTHPFSTDVQLIHGSVMEFPIGLFSKDYEGDAFWLYHLPRMGPKIMVALMRAFEDTARNSDKKVFQDMMDARSCLDSHYLAMKETQVPETLSSKDSLYDEVLEAKALKLALLLYESYVDPQNGIVLEGLREMDSDQLFFINYALGRCESYDSRFAWQAARYGKKPLAAYRVNGPLRNSPDFAEAFNCSVGSYMNPEPKCPVWKP